MKSRRSDFFDGHASTVGVGVVPSWISFAPEIDAWSDPGIFFLRFVTRLSIKAELLFCIDWWKCFDSIFLWYIFQILYLIFLLSNKLIFLYWYAKPHYSLLLMIIIRRQIWCIKIIDAGFQQFLLPLALQLLFPTRAARWIRNFTHASLSALLDFQDSLGLCILIVYLY